MLKKLIAFIHSDEIATLKADLDHSFRTNAFINGSNADLRADNQRLKGMLDYVRDQRDEAARKMGHANVRAQASVRHEQAARAVAASQNAEIKDLKEALAKATHKEKMLRSQAGATPGAVAALRAVIALEESLSGANAVLKETQDELASVQRARDTQTHTIRAQQFKLDELTKDVHSRMDSRVVRHHSSEFSIIPVQNPVLTEGNGTTTYLPGTKWAVYHTRSLERITDYYNHHHTAVAHSYNAIKEYNDRNRA